MDEALLLIFRDQLLTQCKFFLLAAQELDLAVSNDDQDAIFFSIQNLLGTAANIAKALWGKNGTHASDIRRRASRKPLRESLEILDSSPLRNVVMRNHYEHFDERLDDWWKNSKDRIYIDCTIMSAPAVVGVEKWDWFRHYNPSTTDLYFWGDVYNLRAIADEVNRILPLLNQSIAPYLAPKRNK